MSQIQDEPWLSSRELSAELKKLGVTYAPAYLDKLASTGGGPEFRKFGHFRRYKLSKGWEWIEGRGSRPVRSTSELSAA